jgi:hypothetical protein
MRIRTILMLSLLTALFALSACEQGEGDRCETNTDCADDLVCCIPAGTLEGTCQYEENCQDQ